MKLQKKKILIIVLLFLMAFSVCACGEKEKTFTEGNMTITLTDRFEKKEMANADWYYESSSVLVMGIEETRDELEGVGLEVNSLSDYAEAVLDINDISSEPVVSEDKSYIYFEYSTNTNDREFINVSCVYKYLDSYWMINFACYEDDYDELKNQIFEWADSVEFN